MKTLLLSLIFFATAASFAGEIKKEYDVAPGQLLEVDIKTGGSVFIFGEDQNKASVIVNHRGAELSDDVWVDIDKNNRGLKIAAGADGNSYSDLVFKIYVPNKFDLDITTMGGEISVGNVEGELDGETMGGDITLVKLKGNVSFTTMGGDVVLTDSDVDGKISTMGGEVLFENIVGDVKGSSMGGNVIYKNVRGRDGSSTSKEVNISTMGGKIKVDEAISGANVTTMGGDIRIKKAAKYVKASTMGGNIDIDEIDGWINASTMGGDIEIHMVGDPAKGKRDVEISSMSGDIEISLPEGISAEFDIRITYTRNSRKDYEIKSDFPLTIEEDAEWKYGNGDPRKRINGNGKTGNSKNYVKIRTINGNITINKS